MTENLDFHTLDAIHALKHHPGFAALFRVCVLNRLADLETTMEKIPLSREERDAKFPVWQAYRQVKREFEQQIDNAAASKKQILEDDPNLLIREVVTNNKQL